MRMQGKVAIVAGAATGIERVVDGGHTARQAPARRTRALRR